ncbi:TetR/AcrR family transcriptional regulator [Radiobacillus deserti]|uniref:TetR/AcrR family transcriptional regulator n=2 Tax=Radiobacillus deserti TaxID=2594883 RepID=A0A516KC22_9BACI|nr:TetR/AcrR family transcriptional regulator [Radiobacillus deserti]
MNQFVQNGFEKASTNEIVKEAQISKGSLFKYFTNKKDLYLYLLEHAIKVIDFIYDEMDLHEQDLFKRILQIGVIKIKIQRNYPLVFDFLYASRGEQSVQVKSDIDHIMDDTLEDGLKKIYENIDWSKLREDVDPEKALHILNWTAIGFGELQMEKIGSFSNMGEELGTKLLDEWNSYAEILRRSFYKEGE